MTRSLREHEVWFVTGSQRLYGDDVLRRVDEHASWNHAYHFLDRGL